MNCLIAKIKNGSRSITYKKILSGKNIYNSPENLNEAVAYSPNVLLEDGSWYKIDSFSETSYFQEMMKLPKKLRKVTFGWHLSGR